MKSSLAVAALEIAVGARKVAGKVGRSDRGSQLRTRRFVESLRHHELTGSMGRVAARADNAAMESFFSLLQKNILDVSGGSQDKNSDWPPQSGSKGPTPAASLRSEPFNVIRIR